MGKGVNKVTVIGNLGRDPEIRYTQSGSAVCNFSLAVGESRKDGDGWKEHTEWVNVVAFGKTAENVSKFLSKGSQAYVDGRLSTSKYQDKEGNDRYKTEVVANNVIFLGGNGGSGGGQERRGGGNQGPSRNDDGFNDDDDLPF